MVKKGVLPVLEREEKGYSFLLPAKYPSDMSRGHKKAMVYTIYEACKTSVSR